jgi:hypothetical protein
MAYITDTRTLTKARTMVGVFRTSGYAQRAARDLERAGYSPDRVGIVNDNVRQAREMAGSYSPQGALVGAIVGLLVTGMFVVFGGEAVRHSPVGIALGGIALIVAFTGIGWLAGRARLFKQDYQHYEDAVDEGESLLSVVCETDDGAERARAILERAGAEQVRFEKGSETV